jgi:hypothetical protein
MPRDTMGLPERLDRAMLIESASRQIEAHQSGQGQVVRNQPAYQGQRNWRRGLNKDPFRCSYCSGRNTLRSFATLYAQGSSLAKYRKGSSSRLAGLKPASSLCSRCSARHPGKNHYGGVYYF